MQIEIIDINKLLPYINNPRKNLNIDKVASSIKEFGFQQPIVVDKNYIIIVGHTRFEAAKKLGLKEVPVQIADLDEDKAKAYRIADNRLNQDADWDNELLSVELNNLLSGRYAWDHKCTRPKMKTFVKTFRGKISHERIDTYVNLVLKTLDPDDYYDLEFQQDEGWQHIRIEVWDRVLH